MYFFYYYPVGVDVGRPRIPVVSLLLGVSMVAIFLLSLPLRHTNTVDWWAYAYRPASFSLLTPLTACFLHGSWMHLAGNMIYLAVFAPALEKAVGRLGLLVVFCGTGYLGNLVQGAVTLHLNPDQAWGGIVGASGAISGLLGWFFLRYSYSRIKLAYWAFLPLQGINRTGTVFVPVAVGILLWLLLQVVFVLVEGKGSRTAYGAHLGGLFSGIILATALGQYGKGRVELWRVTAWRERDLGNMHAAVAALQKYLERSAWDEEAWLELARLRATCGDFGDALSVYRRLAQVQRDRGNWQKVVAIYSEARRGNSAFVLEPDDQRKVAFLLEKNTRFSDAVKAYLDFARFYPDHAEVEHARVRAATITLVRLDKRREGMDMVGEVIEDFPDGVWTRLLRQRTRGRLRPRTNRSG